MTIEMLAFMELYDQSDNKKHGNFKLSHFDREAT